MCLRDRPTGRRLGLSRNATGDGRGSAYWAVVRFGVVNFVVVVVDRNERQGSKTATMIDDNGGPRKTKLERDKERQSCDSQSECWIISLYFCSCCCVCLVGPGDIKEGR